MSKQSKRARFAHTQRRRRFVARVTKANSHKPGFVGVVTSFTINGEQAIGPGALFIRRA